MKIGDKHFTSSMSKVKKERCPDCVKLEKRIKKLEELVNNLKPDRFVVAVSKPNDDPDIREIDLDLGEPQLSATARTYGEG